MKKNRFFGFIALAAVIMLTIAACGDGDDNDNGDNGGETITSAKGIEMVYVPGGSFQMGNSDTSGGYSDERPVHTVTLTGFYMGKTEVTQAQYQAVMGLCRPAVME